MELQAQVSVMRLAGQANVIPANGTGTSESATEFIVSFFGDYLGNYTADKTYNDVKAARNAGLKIRGMLVEPVCNIMLDDIYTLPGQYFSFSGQYSADHQGGDPDLSAVALYLYNDDTVGFHSYSHIKDSSAASTYAVADFAELLMVVEDVAGRMPIKAEKLLAFSVQGSTDELPTGEYMATICLLDYGDVLLSLQSNYTKLHNTMSGGVWDGWEWENPPLELGYEYRTTERYDTAPVYVQLLDFGLLPNATTKQVYFSDEPVGDVISCEIITRYNQGFAGHMQQISHFYANTDGYVEVKTTVDMRGVSAFARLKYTK